MHLQRVAIGDPHHHEHFRRIGHSWHPMPDKLQGCVQQTLQVMAKLPVASTPAPPSRIPPTNATLPLPLAPLLTLSPGGWGASLQGITPSEMAQESDNQRAGQRWPRLLRTMYRGPLRKAFAVGGGGVRGFDTAPWRTPPPKKQQQRLHWRDPSKSHPETSVVSMAEVFVFELREKVQGKGSGKWREADRRRRLQTAIQPGVMPNPPSFETTEVPGLISRGSVN